MNEIHGDHPPFSPDEIVLIRQWADDAWRKAHHSKNDTSNPAVRDALTARLQAIEGVQEKVRPF